MSIGSLPGRRFSTLPDWRGIPRISKLYRERGKVVTVQPGTPQAVALTLIGGDEVDLARSKPNCSKRNLS